ncbi:Uncharacterised protein [Aeromonas encheleia]|nr:hypothetical protein [Aeromonas encheleia]VEG95759.1 Uncharacterised protein [Aeromonas encheleia]
MIHELALSHYSRQWLGLITTNAKLTSTSYHLPLYDLTPQGLAKAP